MIISYLGYASFKIKSKDAMIIINPFDEKILGCRFEKTKANVVLVSKDIAECNNINAVKENPFIIKGPGEFEIKEVMILGFPSDDKADKEGRNTIFRIEIEGVNLVHLGILNNKLIDEQYEQLGSVDILFIPIGEKGTIDTKIAMSIISRIGPAIVIPMCYFDADLKEGFTDLAKVEKFVENMGIAFPEEMKSLRISSKDFNQTMETTKIVILEKK